MIKVFQLNKNVFSLTILDNFLNKPFGFIISDKYKLGPILVEVLMPIKYIHIFGEIWRQIKINFYLIFMNLFRLTKTYNITKQIHILSLDSIR